MTDFYDSFDLQDDGLFNSFEEKSINKFTNRFQTFQNVVKFSSPFSMKQTSVNSTNSVSTTMKKLSAKTKTRITPIIKEKSPNGESEQGKKTKTVVNLPEGTMNSRVRENLDELLDNTIEKRLPPSIKVEEIRKYVIEFASTYRVRFPKSRDKITLVLLFCIIMSCRLNDLYFDVHLLSIELGIPYKNIVDTINDNLPPITSKDPAHKRLISMIIDIPRTKLLDDYCQVMKTVVEEFKSIDTTGDKDYQPLVVDSKVIEEYRSNCIQIFDMLEKDISCEYERQFCVTPDKVYIYGIFDIIRQKRRTITERSICDYLSLKFQIPRVTVEKMKRLVVKCKKALENDEESE